MSFPNAEAQRIIVVSNRLPFTVTHGSDGVHFEESVGGVASGLRALLFSSHSSLSATSEYIWVGWPGSTIDAELQEGGARMLLTPADRGPVAQPNAGRAAQADAWLAAPVSELSAPHSSRATRHVNADAPGDDPADASLADASVRLSLNHL